MVTSVLDIYNAALSACHARGRVSSLQENSREREECERWYLLTLQTVQEAAHWGGSRRSAFLPLLEEGNPGVQGFSFKYGLPDGFLRPWYMADFSRFSINYEESYSSRVINSGTPRARLIYAALQEDIHEWTPTQRLATIHGLASYIAGSLTGKASIIEKNITLANNMLEEARSYSANEELAFMNSERIPPTIQARLGGVDYRPNQPYIYPLGPMFSVAT